MHVACLGSLWNDTVLTVSCRGPHRHGTVVTSCTLMAFLHDSAGVLTPVGLTVRAVTGVSNMFAGTWGRVYHLGLRAVTVHDGHTAIIEQVPYRTVAHNH